MDLENQYYNSKALKEDDPKAALSSFQKVELHSRKNELCVLCRSLIVLSYHHIC